MIAFRPVENYSVLTPFKVKRLFIDNSKRSLKCVLLHNRNIYGCIPQSPRKRSMETSPMVNLCRFKNGEFSFGSTRRLHRTPLFPLLLG